MKIAAFFDLDGTIVRGTSGIRFYRYLAVRRLLPLHMSSLKLLIKTMYNIFKSEVAQYLDDMDDLMAKINLGVKQSEFKKHAKSYAIRELEFIYKKTLKEINFHRKKGHKLILLTASPDELAQEIKEILRFDYAKGTTFLVTKGRYNGKIVHPAMIGKERAEVVKNIAKKLNIDLKKSYAYGNCINDFNVLELVKYPVAVSPNKFLKPVAIQKDWRIL